MPAVLNETTDRLVCLDELNQSYYGLSLNVIELTCIRLSSNLIF